MLFARITSNSKSIIKVLHTHCGVGQVCVPDFSHYTAAVLLTPYIPGCISVAGFLAWPDFIHSLYLMERKPQAPSTERAMDPVDWQFRKYTRTVRLPLLVAGLGLVGKALYEAGQHVLGIQPMDPATPEYGRAGIALLGFSSAMYLKDRDPSGRAPHSLVSE